MSFFNFFRGTHGQPARLVEPVQQSTFQYRTSRPTPLSQRPGYWGDISRPVRPPKRKRDDDEPVQAAAPKRVRFAFVKADKTNKHTKTVQIAVNKALQAERLGYEEKKEWAVYQAVTKIEEQVEADMGAWKRQFMEEALKQAKAQAEAEYKAKFEEWKQWELKPQTDQERAAARIEVTLELKLKNEEDMEKWKMNLRDKEVELKVQQRWKPLHARFTQQWDMVQRVKKQNQASRQQLYDDKEALINEQEFLETQKKRFENEMEERRAAVGAELGRQTTVVAETEARVEERILERYARIQKDLRRNAKLKGKQLSPKTLKELNVSMEEKPLTPRSQLRFEREIERMRKQFVNDLVEPYLEQIETERKAHAEELKTSGREWVNKCRAELKTLLEKCEAKGADGDKLISYRDLARKMGVKIL